MPLNQHRYDVFHYIVWLIVGSGLALPQGNQLMLILLFFSDGPLVAVGREVSFFVRMDETGYHVDYLRVVMTSFSFGIIIKDRLSFTIFFRNIS